MEVLIQHSNILIAIAVIIGFLMACGIGANDVANAMATSIGTKSLTVIQALIIAAIFEFLGAYLAGGEVVNTIKDGIVDSSAFSGQPINLILGMISALFAAGTWLILASILGWPVSTTHSIIGAVIGFNTRFMVYNPGNVRNSCLSAVYERSDSNIQTLSSLGAC